MAAPPTSYGTMEIDLRLRSTLTATGLTFGIYAVGNITVLAVIALVSSQTDVNTAAPNPS